MNFKETLNGTTLADRLLFITLLLTSLLCMIFVKEVLPHSSEVSIEVEGKILYRYPLDANKLVNVRSRYGHLIVEIRDKKVRVIDASCPNRLCEGEGWVSMGVIICIPNRISVLVGSPGKQHDRTVDAITG